MHDAETIERIRRKFIGLAPVMDERMRRQWAASEATALGWGGVTAVAQATGLAWNTIKAGMRELDERAAHWRGRPLISLQTIVELIGSTTTDTGLIVRAALDKAEYETGIKVSDEQLAQVKLKRADFHGDWNYTVRPRTI